MKKLSLLFFCSLIYFQLAAQLKEIFSDDFSSNKNQWAQGKIEGLYAEVKDGKYIIECGPKNELYPQIVFGIDSTKDYTINLTLSQSKALMPKSGGGIIFGSNLSDYYCFYITSDGNCGLAEIKNNKIVSDKSGISDEAIKTGAGATNKLKIKKWETFWEFLVNDKLVYMTISDKLKGLYMGLIALPGGKYEFDNLKIEGTPIATSGSLCQIFPMIYESAKNNFFFIKGMQKNPDDSTNFTSAINFGNNYFGTFGKKNDYSTLYALLKQTSTKEEAIKELKLFIAELQICLPGFQFTEGKKANGDPEYIISEKTKEPVKGLRVLFDVSDSSVRNGYALYINVRKQ